MGIGIVRLDGSFNCRGDSKVYTVTRQCSWPDENYIVEISYGGIDYTNPDALRERYPGEFKEYDDPREAVSVAIQIAHSWQADRPKEEIFIGRGATGGMTMPFDPEPLNEETFAEFRSWADKRYAELPKCSQCGDILPDNSRNRWRLLDHYFEGEFFCREYCAETFYENAEGYL